MQNEIGYRTWRKLKDWTGAEGVRATAGRFEFSPAVVKLVDRSKSYADYLGLRWLALVAPERAKAEDGGPLLPRNHHLIPRRTPWTARFLHNFRRFTTGAVKLLDY